MTDSTDHNRWLERANQDLKMLNIINKEGLEGMEDSFCYITHQAAEKLLKAFIVKNERSILKSHDLVFLLGKCIKYKSTLVKLTDVITILNEYAVSARYPDDFGDKRTLGDAMEAYHCIKEVELLFL